MHECISINRQLTSPTESNFAGKRSMECRKQNKDLVRNKIKHQKTYKIGKLVREKNQTPVRGQDGKISDTRGKDL